MRHFDIFVRDLQTTVTSYVSRATGPTGVSGNGDSYYPSISADGRYVACSSPAASLSPDDGDPLYDIFVRDLQSNRTIYVSRATGEMGLPATRIPSSPRSPATGATSPSSRLPRTSAPRTPTLVNDVFVRDLQTNTTTFVSRASGGSGAGGDGHSFAPSISADGRYVAFESEANNLSGADDNAVRNVFVRDLQTGVTTYVNQAIGGAAAGGDSSEPSISADGRYVAFSSDANNLTTDDNDTYQNVYVRDLQASTITYVSRGERRHGSGGRQRLRRAFHLRRREVRRVQVGRQQPQLRGQRQLPERLRAGRARLAGGPAGGRPGHHRPGCLGQPADARQRNDPGGPPRPFQALLRPVQRARDGHVRRPERAPVRAAARRKRTLRLGNRAFSAQAGRRSWSASGSRAPA